MEEYLTLNELNIIFNKISKGILRLYLENYRFTKFRKFKLFNNRKKLVYLFNEYFLDEFEEFLILRRNYKALKCVKKYRGENELLENNNR